jgi:hypothetical protein
MATGLPPHPWIGNAQFRHLNTIYQNLTTNKENRVTPFEALQELRASARTEEEAELVTLFANMVYGANIPGS